MMTKRIVASNRSLAAGRDINLNITIGPDGLSPIEILKQFCKEKDLNFGRIMQAIESDSSSTLSYDQLFDLLNRLSFEAELEQTIGSGKYKTLSEGAGRVAEKAQFLQTKLDTIATALNAKNYGVAYAELRGIVTGDFTTDRLSSTVVEDCFQCGYLHLANQGKTSEFDELFDLLDVIDAASVSPSTLLFVAEMQQEHATRLSSNEDLIKNLSRIRELREKLEVNLETQERLKILEALCLRRIGERGDQEALNEAESILAAIQIAGSMRPIELSNTLLNVQNRLYSRYGDESALSRAKITIESAPSLPENAELIEYQSFPKLMNAIGNYHKQVLKQTKGAPAYGSAIEFYSKTEVFWNEENAPYEWAMIQKNKADVRELFLRDLAEVDQSLIITAWVEILQSLKHRRKDNAEYQYFRSIEVQKRLEVLSSKHGVTLPSTSDVT